MYTDKLTATASPNAGGNINATFTSDDTSSQAQKAFALKSFERFSQCQKGTHPFIKEAEDAVRRLPSYGSWRKSQGLEAYVDKGLMSGGHDVNLQILDSEVTHKMYCYPDAMHVNPPLFLYHVEKQLMTQLSFVEMHVENFDQIPANVVFNCTGTSAGRLNGRVENYMPTLGHFFLLGNQDTSSKERGFHNAMLVAPGADFTTSNGLSGRTGVHLFPRTGTIDGTDNNYQAFLGGSYIKGVELDKLGFVTKEFENPEPFDFVLDNARKFFGKFSH
jgi:hypothetical protein